MKDIFSIIFRLTVSCLLAAVVMGTAFVVTNKAKKHNEHVREDQTVYSLLGYGKDKAAPASLGLHPIYRYVVTEGEKQEIGYLLSTKAENKEAYVLVLLDLEGRMTSKKLVEIDEEKAKEREDRDKAVQKTVGAGKTSRFADHTIVVTDNDKRVAYLLGGKFPGFKTYISVMVATDPAFGMLGLEVLEHEEDPGLGAEIEKNYFKKQFIGKPFSALKELKVVKAPQPAEYSQALDGDLTKADIKAVVDRYKDKDIYALTGATISSRMTTDGVKGMVKKFAYRIDILDKVLKEQQIAVSF